MVSIYNKIRNLLVKNETVLSATIPDRLEEYKKIYFGKNPVSKKQCNKDLRYVSQVLKTK